MASVSAPGSRAPSAPAETNTIPVKVEETKMKEEQWRAIRNFIDSIYAHRLPEYVGGC